MTEVVLYQFPSCDANCSVAPDLVGLNFVYPSRGQEFTATPPDTASDFQLSNAVPFFKSGKIEILTNHLKKLISAGELSKAARSNFTGTNQ